MIEWIIVVAVGVALGMVLGDWLRRGAYVSWIAQVIVYGDRLTEVWISA